MIKNKFSSTVTCVFKIMKISDLTLKLESRNKVTGLLHRKQASIEIKGLGDVSTNLHEIKAIFVR